jgi:hypothetical protein
VSDDFKQMMQDMKNAVETPSEQCAEGDMHNFQFMAHADGTEYFSNYFKCPNCREVIVQRQKRTGLNKRLWQDNV